MCVKVYGNWWCESCSICTEAIPSFWCTIQKFLLRVYIPGAIQITVVLSFLELLSCTPFSRREFYKHLTHKPGMGKWQWKYPHVLSYLEKFTLFFCGGGGYCMHGASPVAGSQKERHDKYICIFQKGLRNGSLGWRLHFLLAKWVEELYQFVRWRWTEKQRHGSALRHGMEWSQRQQLFDKRHKIQFIHGLAGASHCKGLPHSKMA